MHEKLSQAVKLYDKLLTEQISHRPWMTKSPVASTSSQPPAGYASPVQSIHLPQNHWQPTPRMQVASPAPVLQSQSSHVSYLPSQQPVTQLSTAMSGVSISSPSVGPYHTQAYQPPPPPPVLSPNQSFPDILQSPQSLTASVGPTTMQPYLSHATPKPFSPVSMSSTIPPPSNVQEYQVAQPFQSVPPPPPIHSIPQVNPSSPSHSVSLSRHNTVATHPITPHPSSTYSARLPVRSNTMTHAPQQLQHLQQTAAPPQLPAFPSVPSSPPQSYQMYNQPTQPEPERKEALLIEL